MSMQDPISDASAFLETAIGTDEQGLRARLGNDGYEQHRNDQRRIAAAHVEQCEVVTEQGRRAARLLEARAAFWWALAVSVAVLAACALVLTLWTVR